MSSYDECRLREDLKLRKKILSLGIGRSIIGPTGPKGEQGPRGESATSSTESIFFSSYDESSEIGELLLTDSWTLPNPSEYFIPIDEYEIEVQPGVYEMSFSGLITGVDETHGAEFYLADGNNSAIKDLHFKLESGNGKQMSFSKHIVFRFEDITNLHVEMNITGEEDSSNIKVSDVTLLLKKIKE